MRTFINFTIPYQMKVHLVKKQTIEDYGMDNAGSRISFRLWLLVLNGVDWNEPGDILKTFGSTDLLGNGCDRAVFDIGGKNYPKKFLLSFFGKTVSIIRSLLLNP